MENPAVGVLGRRRCRCRIGEPPWPAFLPPPGTGLVVALIKPDGSETELDKILELIRAQGLVRANKTESLDRPQMDWKGLSPTC